MSGYPTNGFTSEGSRKSALLGGVFYLDSGGNLSNRFEAPMQFGRVFGLFLISLGIILLILQAALFLWSRRTNTARSSVKIEQRSNANPLSGIVGAACIVGGIGFHSMARRGDESESRSRSRV